MQKKIQDKRLLAAVKMPPLKKKPDAVSEYDFRKDEVVQWLAQQPEIMAYVAELVQRLGYIKFDPVTRTWRGAEL